jgi:hypothetical protein
MHQHPPSTNNPLQRFVGSWQGEVRVDSPGLEPQRYTQQNTWAWTLGEQFLQERGTGSNGSSFLGVWSQDPQSGRYRAHYFVAPSGDVVVLTHDWNEHEQRFVGSADLGGGLTMRAEDRFLADDTYEWSIAIEDASGKVLTSMRACERRVGV